MYPYIHKTYLIMMPGWGELIILFLILLLVFGAKRLPEIAKGLGKGIREFKKAISRADDSEDESKEKRDEK